MKNGKLRKLLTAFAITFAVAAGGLSTAPAAQADTGGGIGGGGGPGGAYDGFQWVSVAYAEKGRSWNKFVEISGWDLGTINREVKNRVGNIDVCKNSNVIWFIASKGWTYNFTGWTWPSNWIVAGTIENPRTKVGERAASAAEVQAFKDWDWNSNGRKIGNTPGYTIICSGAFKKPDLSWTTSSSSNSNVQDSDSWTQPYSWTTEIKRQITEGGKDPIGKDNLHDQKAITEKTEYGKLYDNIVRTTGKGLNPDQMRAQVFAAIEKDRKKNHAVAALDDLNKEGMAEGGVLNVNEQTKYATIATTRTKTHTDVTTCKWSQTWNTSVGNYNAATKSCSTKRTTVEKSTASRSLGTQYNSGFWQMLTVHCNLADFQALRAADPSITAIASSGPNKITAVAHTKKYLTQPKNLDFGDKTNPNKAKAKTGTLAFYDKECAFDCVPVASSETPGDAPTAVSEDVASTKFEFFRDNTAKNITVDTWAPKSGVDGVQVPANLKASSTTVTRWSQGTPSTTGEAGGKFSMKSLNGNKELFTGKDTTKTQKNFDLGLFSNANATILSGHHNKFAVQSTWASEAEKPQKLNFKWEYKPNVSTSFPLTGIGFGVESAQRIGTVGAVVTNNIEGKCYGKFGTSITTSEPSVMYDNTGTGTVNNLDKDIRGANEYNLTTNFVRSVGE